METPSKESARVPIGIVLGGGWRQEADRDLRGTLERLRDLGYLGVEFGRSTDNSREVARYLSELRLKAICFQTTTEDVKNDFDRVLSDALEIGCRFVVMNWQTFASLQSVLEFARFYDSQGARFRRHGIQFCYHNHAHEFQKYGGNYVLDLLMENSAPENLQLQFDTFWLKVAEIEPPAAYVSRYKGRNPLFHFQDKQPSWNVSLPFQSNGWLDYSPLLTEVGTGVVDFPAVYQAARDNGALWCSVEQWVASPRHDPFESARLSLENLRRLGIAPAAPA